MNEQPIIQSVSELLSSEELELARDDDSIVGFVRKNTSHIPRLLTCRNVSGQVRQRFVENGMLDNVILNISEAGAFYVGKWILSTLFHQRFDNYTLAFQDSLGGIDRIRIQLQHEPKLEVKLEKFVWEPEKPDSFILAPNLYYGQMLSFAVTNDVDEWLSVEEFYQRNTLLFNGYLGGLCFLAEFFLNLGLYGSETGFEILRHTDLDINVANQESCELRIQIL